MHRLTMIAAHLRSSTRGLRPSLTRTMCAGGNYEYITTETQDNGVAVITLNRPKVREDP